MNAIGWSKHGLTGSTNGTVLQGSSDVVLKGGYAAMDGHIEGHPRGGWSGADWRRFKKSDEGSGVEVTKNLKDAVEESLEKARGSFVAGGLRVCCEWVKQQYRWPFHWE
jgi:hypothetical protein